MDSHEEIVAFRQRVREAFPDVDVVFSSAEGRERVAYAVNKKVVIGKGAHGVVYAARTINGDTLELDISKEGRLVAKKIRDIDQFKPEEIQFFKRYYKIGDVCFFSGDAYQIMNYLPGGDLYSLSGQLKPILSSSIDKLGFSNRVALVQAIMMFVNLMHHDTPATGKSLIHSDLNGSNIRGHIRYNPETGELLVLDTYLIDFALATEVDDNPDKINNDQPIEGTLYYMPIEVKNEKRGIKSDIYALSPIFMILFGAVDPFKVKAPFNFISDDFFLAGYSFDGLFSGYEIPEYAKDILPYLKFFLYKMHHNDYEKRPDSDKVLRFFTTLNNFCKSFEVREKDSDARYARIAILALLASGFWTAVCERTGDDPFKFSFEKLALSSHAGFCRDVVRQTGLNSTESLDSMSLDELRGRMLTDVLLTELLIKHKIEPATAEIDSNVSATQQESAPDNITFFRVKSGEYDCEGQDISESLKPG